MASISSLRFRPRSTPINSPAGEKRLFLAEDGLLKTIDDAGVVEEVGGGGPRGPITLSGITDMTADGRLLNAKALADMKTFLGISELPASATQAEAEAGTESSLRMFSPQRIAQAIAALAPSGGSSITVSRTVFVDLSGNDTTGAIGDPSKPFLTAQAAYDAVPSGSNKYRMVLGVGDYTIELAADWNPNLASVVGAGGELTSLGVFAGGPTGSAGSPGTNGADGTGSGNGSNGDTGGTAGDGGSARNVTIYSDFSVDIAVNACGGDGGWGGAGGGAGGGGGAASTDGTYYGNPGNGGTGGNGGNGGNGGTITLVRAKCSSAVALAGEFGNGGLGGSGGTSGWGECGNAGSFGSSGTAGTAGTIKLLECDAGTIGLGTETVEMEKSSYVAVMAATFTQSPLGNGSSVSSNNVRSLTL